VRDLVDRYFSQPIGNRCAGIAGAIVGAAEQRALAARYARSREYLRQDANLRDPRGPRAALANLLVRRSAWEEVGGLSEGIRCAEDTDFCWRLVRAGWSLEYREEALVEHLHRERLWELLVQNARYVAGAAWLNRRYPGSYPREPAAGKLVRCAAGIAAWTATARFERALFKAIDALVIAAEMVGWLMSNRA
jgi:GT2 family glycosyltransferase